jgi:hypothetical protein
MEGLLEKCGLSTSQFTGALDECGAIIAGSAALWASMVASAVEPDYTPGDIDIWAPIGRSAAICLALSEHGYCLVKIKNAQDRKAKRRSQYGPPRGKGLMYILDFVKIEGDEAARHTIMRTGGYHNPRAAAGSRTGGYHNPRAAAGSLPVQMIVVEGDNMPKYVFENFDFTVCQTWWAPATGLCMADPDAVASKTIVISKPDEYLTSSTTGRRIVKYIQRGFTAAMYSSISLVPAGVCDRCRTEGTLLLKLECGHVVHGVSVDEVRRPVTGPPTPYCLGATRGSIILSCPVCK